MDKNFDQWNEIKKSVNNKKTIIKFQQYQVLFVHIGANVGYEQDGKNKEYLRPVLVYKKFNNYVFLGIPLTTKPKYDKFHFEFEYKKGKKSFAILSQIRLFDIKRVKYYSGKISKKHFKELQAKLLNLIVTPLQKEGECTKAICNDIIHNNYQNVNVLVTGANGQLGSEMKHLILNDKFSMLNKDSKFYFTTSSMLDITNYELVRRFCDDNEIKIIINCAAYTAVDKAESNEKLANAVNHFAVKNLAQIAKDRNIKLIHISTDYVFDGKNYKPYIESDMTNPTGVYGKTKLDGEKAMICINPKNSVIIRTSWVYSSYGSNFVKTMLRLGKERDELGVVYDQIGTPTYAKDLASAILKIVDVQCSMFNTKCQIPNDKSQMLDDKMINNDAKNIEHQTLDIYHYSNEGAISWYDFAKAIFEIANINIKVKPIETKEYPTPAQRPHYSLLNKAKIKKEFGIEIPYWRDSLFDCIKKIMSYEC